MFPLPEVMTVLICDNGQKDFLLENGLHEKQYYLKPIWRAGVCMFRHIAFQAFSYGTSFLSIEMSYLGMLKGQMFYAG